MRCITAIVVFNAFVGRNLVCVSRFRLGQYNLGCSLLIILDALVTRVVNTADINVSCVQVVNNVAPFP